jgi:hypothetical protein
MVSGFRHPGSITPTAVLLGLYGLLWLPAAHAQNRAAEVAFAAIPFQQWIAQGPKAELPWHPRITSPELTLHQRIALRVAVELDGRELVKRCCEGQAVALVEITDQQGRTFRNFAAKELQDAKPGLRQYMVSMSWQVFLLPGEYKVAVAFYYTGGSGHSLSFQRVHVAPLKHDPLPESWRDLPTVEFCDQEPDGIDAFLLPDVQGRLRLPAKSHRQIHLDILENVTPYPSERRRPNLYWARLAVFLPILKTLSQLDMENGTLGLSLLDFTRRSVIFDQQDIKDGQVSWKNLKEAMAANSVAVVNAHDLEQGEEFGQFFWTEMARRLEDAGSAQAMRAFIVISAPMHLGSRKPIEIVPPARGNFVVFYLRCDFLQTPAVTPTTIFAGPVEPTEQRIERSEDGIGKALRELKPRVFALHSAQSAREALATILADLQKM